MKTGKSSTASRSFAYYGLRITFVVVVLLIASGLYQYLSATPEKLFAENFRDYHIDESSGYIPTITDSLYKKGDFKYLIRHFNQMEKPSASDYFLAGVSYLHLRQAGDAIETFNSLIQLNLTENTHLFDKDTDYYISLSYLSNGDPGKALPLLEKIYTDADHPYHPFVSAWLLQKVKRTIKHPD